MIGRYGQPELELIDTLWNVNKLETYMLNHIEEELIDTLWNVNEDVINGTWGEVWN